MLESWWSAHALEVVLEGVLVGAIAVWWFFDSIAAAWEERKRKKRDGLL